MLLKYNYLFCIINMKNEKYLGKSIDNKIPNNLFFYRI